MEEVRVQASARISTPDESPANKPLQPPSGMALGCYRGGTAVSQQRPDYSWLIDSRSRIQAVLLALHESVSSADKRDRLAQEPMDRDVFVLLMGAAFSLWRAAFLSHAEHMWPEILTHANKFLEILIADNAINYPQDRDTRDWSGGYYLANARYRLVRALDIMGLASSGYTTAAQRGLRELHANGIESVPANVCWNTL
jgi:hypothetical protein